MNIKKITLEKEAFISHAVRFGVPTSILAEVCEVREHTIYKYTANIRKDLIKEFIGYELLLEMFKLYAWSITEPIAFNNALGYSEKMTKALYRYLKLNIWFSYCKGVFNTVALYDKIVFDPEITVKQREFIVFFYGENKTQFSPEKLFQKIIKEMYITSDYPKSKDMINPEKALNHFLEKFLEKERTQVNHFISKDFLSHIISLSSDFLGYNDFLMLDCYYGLSGEESMTYEDISKLPAFRNITPERIKTIKEKTLDRLKRNHLLFPKIPKWSDCLNVHIEQINNIKQLELNTSKCKKNQDDLFGQALLLAQAVTQYVSPTLITKSLRSAVLTFLPEHLDTIDPQIKYDAIQLEALTTSISNLALSVRTYNALNDRGVVFVWQLCSLDISDLLKLRNFGKKSLSEIEEVVRDFRLCFGLMFNAPTSQYLAEKTKVGPLFS